ncbi:MAG TPA: crossover junction endodeoxyribonuclease RuvC [Acidimicrobiales bacterium]|jgi:crossover junction endodeoxyribonuclease RuvC
MFVLGVDPGLTRCGFGLVEGAMEGLESFNARRAGTIETSPTIPVELRLRQLFQEFSSLLEECSPDAVSVEKVFHSRNANTVIGVAQASGVVIALAGARNIPVRQFTAQQVKLAVTGYGAAQKPQVQAMVARHCRLASVPEPPDAADALALAITYLSFERTERRFLVERGA